ncbi:MAG: CpsD/CapB family tyrosine-protein kinase [Clostridia bacterium]|nr:CpsD/CapB family tyrosine-protein kinase [Clostridia bacterium]
MENNEYKNNVISFLNPKSIVSESFRALRTNLEFSMSQDNKKVILFTSSHVSEGKSSCAANLAAVFAMQGKKTLLIDADMRRGVQHKNFGVEKQNGLSNFLSNVGFKTQGFFKPTDISNLVVITCGTTPPNPAELLSSHRFKKLLEDYKSFYDIIIIDGAPVLPVTDSVIVAPLVDKIVIVAAYGETHKDELKLVKTTLENSGGDIAGLVLNKVDSRTSGYSKYGKYRKYNSNYYAYYSNEEKK